MAYEDVVVLSRLRSTAKATELRTTSPRPSSFFSPRALPRHTGSSGALRHGWRCGGRLCCWRRGLRGSTRMTGRGKKVRACQRYLPYLPRSTSRSRDARHRRLELRRKRPGHCRSSRTAAAWRATRTIWPCSLTWSTTASLSCKTSPQSESAAKQAAEQAAQHAALAASIGESLEQMRACSAAVPHRTPRAQWNTHQRSPGLSRARRKRRGQGSGR